MEGPELMRKQLCAAVLAWSSSATGLRRTSTAKSARRSISAFLRWVQIWNHQNEGSSPLKSLADITPFHLRTYDTFLAAQHSVHTCYHYYVRVAALIKLCADVPIETRKWAARPRREALPESRAVQRYPNKEFLAIRRAARQVVVAAHQRISGAYTLAQEHNQVSCSDPIRAKALHEVLVYGAPQSALAPASPRSMPAEGKRPPVAGCF